MIRVAVMGYGTIGSGVVEVLDINKNSIAKRAGEEIGVKYILDLRDFPGDPIQEKVVHDYKVIANDPEVQIVVETMGGVEPAYTFVKAMLEAGKHVTTSNKALVAAKGAELIALAKEKNVNFMFEASVGGGIPIIRPISQCLAANDVTEIAGILNGTTNFILTKMIREQMNMELLEIWEKTGKTIIFITHNIEEAVLLSSRVYVMGTNPGRLVETVTLDLPRPRNLSMITQKKFIEYRQLLESYIGEIDLSKIK